MSNLEENLARMDVAIVRRHVSGLYQDALSSFEMSVGHYDKDAKAYHYLALACLKVMGQVRKGVDAIETAIRLDPNNGWRPEGHYRDLASVAKGDYFLSSIGDLRF